MTSLMTQPQLLARAAAGLTEINSAIDEAKAAAAGPTIGVVAAAQDEVSAAAAKLFGGYAQEYQALLKGATAFQDQFAATLTSASTAYAAAEAASAAAISRAVGLLPSPIQSLLGATAFTTGPRALAVVQPNLLAPNLGFFMGSSGKPFTPPSYLAQVANYVNAMVGVGGTMPIPPTLSGIEGLFTPEGLYPTTAIKDLTLAVSVERGVTILDNLIQQQLIDNPLGSTSIFGYSQSAIIASIEMQHLASPGYTGTVPNADQLGFTLVGDPMNPNGGLLQRFTPLTFPALGLNFYGATPSDTIYPTNIYTIQYDGYADFPRYPINLLADLNAFLGIEMVHGTYPDIITSPNNYDGYTQVQLGTSPGYSGVTNYYMLTNDKLPILEPLKSLPLIGSPLYDLLKPNMTTLVNLGYGNPDYGYSGYPGDNTYADQATTFGLFPHYPQLADKLWEGTVEGWNAFTANIQSQLPVASAHLSSSLSLAGIEHALAGGGGGFTLPAGLASSLASPSDFIESIQTFNTNFTNGVTSAVSDSYAWLLPTADITNTVLTTLPAWNTNLRLDGLGMMIDGDFWGGLQYAVVAPIASNVGMFTLAGGFELIVTLDTIENVIDDLTSI
jgi:hypothetical protein